MRSIPVALLTALLAAPLVAQAAEQLIPAGSLIQCTVAEPKISSKNTAVGDPVLCRISHAERYGRSSLPYDSYLVGQFEAYKDPGHFVGKGWMQLEFDRMVIEPDTVIPISAKVVDVPGYAVDRQGRILGKGHTTRDIVEWSIPILWPIDLLTLPRRGPSPTLKEETRLTLKVMDDLGVPIGAQPTQDPSGLYRRPSAYEPPAPPPPPPPDETAQAYPAPPPQPEYVQPPPYSMAPPQPVYVPQPVLMPPPPPPYYMPPPPPRTVVIYRNGYAYRLIVP